MPMDKPTNQPGGSAGVGVGVGTGGARRLRLRERVTLVATVVLAVAQLLGGWLFLRATRADQFAQLDRTAVARLDEVSELVAAGEATSPLPGARDLYVQVIDRTGHVVAATRNVSDMTAFVNVKLVPLGMGKTFTGSGRVENSAVRLCTRAVVVNGQKLGVYVAAPTRSVQAAVRTLRGRLLAMAPLVMLGSALVLWLVVGRALRPVERLRREVAEFGPKDLGRRVTAPPVDDEIGRLARTMNAMLDRLQAAGERQQRFVSDASHELRSPLAVQRTRLEVALRHPDRTDWPETATGLLQEGRRMERLVDALLMLARGDQGPQVTRHRPVELDSVVHQEVEAARSLRPVRIDVRGVSGGQVTGDEDQLRRVVGNLLDNATRHAEKLVAVGLAPTGDGFVEITVDDDGPGIPRADRGRVFERFARLDESRVRSKGGTGLGLAIVMEAVELHHGTIQVTDSPLGGARFVVRLPEA
jgi:signal transduction histidine kinase